MPEYKRMSELFSQYIEKCAYIQQMIAPSSWNELYARQFILKSVQLHSNKYICLCTQKIWELFSQYVGKCAYIQQMLAPSSWNKAIC